MTVKLTDEEFYACTSVMEREVERESVRFLMFEGGDLANVRPLRDVLFAVHTGDPVSDQDKPKAVAALMSFVTAHSTVCEDEECAFRFLPSAIAKLTG